MDKLEYIPGDLVMTNGVPLGTAQNVVYREHHLTHQRL